MTSTLLGFYHDVGFSLNVVSFQSRFSVLFRFGRPSALVKFHYRFETCNISVKTNLRTEVYKITPITKCFEQVFFTNNIEKRGFAGVIRKQFQVQLALKNDLEMARAYFSIPLPSRKGKIYVPHSVDKAHLVFCEVNVVETTI